VKPQLESLVQRVLVPDHPNTWGLALSLDDIVLDLLSYIRRFNAYLRPRGSRLPDLAQLEALAEQRIALFIPCWHEANIVDRMLAAALQNIHYHNYEIFVGVYPNDDETCAKVDLAVARFSNVRKVVNPRPGPTTKAQNLNAMYDQMRRLEGDRPFSIIVLHDVEDVIHPLSLSLFNGCVPRHPLC
jgi:bacteriophage N4 adsorption protein B